MIPHPRRWHRARARVGPVLVAIAVVAAACGSGGPDETTISGDDSFSSTSTREDTVARIDPERSTDTQNMPDSTTTTNSGAADSEDATDTPNSTAAPSATGAGDDDSDDETTVPQRTDKVVDDGPIVVVAFEGVLGWWDGSWHGVEDGAVPTEVGDQYDIVTLDGDPSIAIGGGLTSTCPFNDTPGVVVGLTGPTEWFDPVPIAVHNAPNVQPRSIAASNQAPDGYDEIAANYLAGRGLNSAGASVVQFIKADLEGDGVDETFLIIEKMSNALNPAQPGDYSIAVMRQVANDGVQTVLIDESLTRAPASEGEVPTLDIFRFAALADLNADGDFEVALNSQGYEGSSTAVYDQDGAGQSLSKILATGCGV